MYHLVSINSQPFQFQKCLVPENNYAIWKVTGNSRGEEYKAQMEFQRGGSGEANQKGKPSMGCSAVHHCCIWNIDFTCRLNFDWYNLSIIIVVTLQQEYFLEMSVCEIKEYMKNLFIALKRVHSFDVIHRDVKPSNFLYSRDTGRWADSYNIDSRIFFECCIAYKRWFTQLTVKLPINK